MVYLIVTIAFLLLTNLWLFSRYAAYRAKVKQKGLLKPWPISQVSVNEIDDAFETTFLGPTLKAEVKFIGRGNLNVPGGTSDTEAWVLAVLSKGAKNIFEFGTCTGKTTYLMAINSNENARIMTITLSPTEIDQYEKKATDDKGAIKDALSESAFTKFLYANTNVESKITQLFGDSKHFDETPYRKKMDLVFIDGSHAYSYVLSDSQKAFEMLAPKGMILWHDYRGPNQTKDVFKALNELSKKVSLMHIKETSLVVYKNN
jgi:predicted O-methyltransferase YrrM